MVVTCGCDQWTGKSDNTSGPQISQIKYAFCTQTKHSIILCYHLLQALTVLL